MSLPGSDKCGVAWLILLTAV